MRDIPWYNMQESIVILRLFAYYSGSLLGFQLSPWTDKRENRENQIVLPKSKSLSTLKVIRGSQSIWKEMKSLISPWSQRGMRLNIDCIDCHRVLYNPTCVLHGFAWTLRLGHAWDILSWSTNVPLTTVGSCENSVVKMRHLGGENMKGHQQSLIYLILTHVSWEDLDKYGKVLIAEIVDLAAPTCKAHQGPKIYSCQQVDESMSIRVTVRRWRSRCRKQKMQPKMTSSGANVLRSNLYSTQVNWGLVDVTLSAKLFNHDAFACSSNCSCREKELSCRQTCPKKGLNMFQQSAPRPWMLDLLVFKSWRRPSVAFGTRAASQLCVL